MKGCEYAPSDAEADMEPPEGRTTRAIDDEKEQLLSSLVLFRQVGKIS